MSFHGPTYGLDAELEAKRRAQYDINLEKEAIRWIELKTGETINDFHNDLKSGVILCNLINSIQSGKISKINKSKIPFQMMENIACYLAACSDFGMRTHDLFQTIDLYEAKNLKQVVNNILQLKKLNE